LITEVEHHNFTVSNMEEALHFFCDQLGLERPETVELEGEPVESILGIPGVHIRIAFVPLPGGTSLELIEYLNPIGHAIDPATPNPGVSHVAFVVEGLDRMYESLSAKGLAFVAPPVWTVGADAKGRAGTWASSFLRGPDGILVELFENKFAQTPTD